MNLRKLINDSLVWKEKIGWNVKAKEEIPILVTQTKFLKYHDLKLNEVKNHLQLTNL